MNGRASASSSLRKPEIEQLRDNAGELGANDVVVLCEEVLRARPRAARAAPRARASRSGRVA